MLITTGIPVFLSNLLNPLKLFWIEALMEMFPSSDHSVLRLCLLARMPKLEVIKIELVLREILRNPVHFSRFPRFQLTARTHFLLFSHALQAPWLYPPSSNYINPLNFLPVAQQRPSRPPCKTLPPRHGHSIDTRPYFFYVSIYNVGHEHRGCRGVGTI